LANNFFFVEHDLPGDGEDENDVMQSQISRLPQHWFFFHNWTEVGYWCVLNPEAKWPSELQKAMKSTSDVDRSLSSRSQFTCALLQHMFAFQMPEPLEVTMPGADKLFASSSDIQTVDLKSLDKQSWVGRWTKVLQSAAPPHVAREMSKDIAQQEREAGTLAASPAGAASPAHGIRDVVPPATPATAAIESASGSGHTVSFGFPYAMPSPGLDAMRMFQLQRILVSVLLTHSLKVAWFDDGDMRVDMSIRNKESIEMIVVDKQKMKDAFGETTSGTGNWNRVVNVMPFWGAVSTGYVPKGYSFVAYRTVGR
jgi:hypothetical protein